MADRHAKRVVALFSASPETIDLLQWMRGISGVNEFIWCRFEDVKTGRVDFTEYLTEHNPEVVIIDISPPYQENWQFFQTLRASRGSGEALLAPTVPGEIVILELDGVNEYMVQKDGFLAGADAIVIESKMQSLSRGLLGGEGFFILKISGKGMLVLNSFGAIHKIELKPDQEYIVDNSHLVAWSTTTSYNIEKATSGWVASFTSGEGFVCRFRGPGLVYIQSRNPGSFGAWIRQFIPVSQ